MVAEVQAHACRCRCKVIPHSCSEHDQSTRSTDAARPLPLRSMHSSSQNTVRYTRPAVEFWDVASRSVRSDSPRELHPSKKTWAKASCNGSTWCETKHGIARMNRGRCASLPPHASDGGTSCCTCIRRRPLRPLATSASPARVLTSRASVRFETGAEPRRFPIQPEVERNEGRWDWERTSGQREIETELLATWAYAGRAHARRTRDEVDSKRSRRDPGARVDGASRANAAVARNLLPFDRERKELARLQAEMDKERVEEHGTVSPRFDLKHLIEDMDSPIDRRSELHRRQAEEERHWKRQMFPMNVPNVLTLLRLACVPASAFLYFSEQDWAKLTTAILFVVASVTDWLDGYLARRWGMCSTFGAFLDPVADKVMVTTSLILLSVRPPQHLVEPAWLVSVPSMVIVAREITISSLREWAAIAEGGHAHGAMKVNALGKWKTATQMTAMSLLLFCREPHTLYTLRMGWLDSALFELGSFRTSALSVALLYVAALLAFLSQLGYFWNVWNHFLQATKKGI